MPEQVEVFFGERPKPIGDFILLQFDKDVRPLVSKGGIIEPGKKEGRYLARVAAFGREVKKDLEFGIGDLVIYNQFDIKYLEEYETKQTYGLTKAGSIMAVYKIDEDL